MASDAITLTALDGVPLITPGDDLTDIVCAALVHSSLHLRDGDVLVVAQKIVSKAEGRYIELAAVTPSPRAVSLANEVDKDPRLVEIILSEAREVVRSAPGVLIVEHRRGFVMANAGVDRSNVGPPGAERVLLLPQDPDASAAALKATLDERLAVDAAVVINDSVGRAWRNGTCAIALGCAGLPALCDLRGRLDLNARALEVSQVGFADQIAAAAALLMGEAGEGKPLVVVRGLTWSQPAAPAAALLRAKERDLFR